MKAEWVYYLINYFSNWREENISLVYILLAILINLNNIKST